MNHPHMIRANNCLCFLYNLRLHLAFQGCLSFFPRKGQLISEGNFGPKKRTTFCSKTHCIYLLGAIQLIFFLFDHIYILEARARMIFLKIGHFLGDMKTPKFSSENTWPLDWLLLRWTSSFMILFWCSKLILTKTSIILLKYS